MSARKPPLVPRAIVTFSLSVHDLVAVDEAARRRQMTRAQFIREEALRGTRRVLRKLDGEPLAA